MIRKFFRHIEAKIKAGLEIIVVVHSGQFHADDLMCISLLRWLFPNAKIKVVRSRDPKVWETADLILDVGERDYCDGIQLWLDHHQKPKEVRANGIIKSACGKLADALLADKPDFLARLQQELLFAVEAVDNAQNPQDFGLRGSKLSFVSLFNPIAMGGEICTDETYDSAFESVSKMVDSVLERAVLKVKADIAAEEGVQKALDEYDGNGVFVLPIPTDSYLEKLVYLNDTLPDDKKAVFAAVRCDDWKAGAVWTIRRKLDDPKDTISDLPEAWGGKRDGALDEVTGLSGGIFCHRDRFLTVWKDFDTSVKAARLALDIVRGGA